MSAAAAAPIPLPFRWERLPNGHWITVCADHKRNVCRDCRRDWSHDLGFDDYLSDDEEEEGGGLFGRDPVDRKPRNVSYSDLVRSKWGTRKIAARPRPVPAGGLPVIRDAIRGIPFAHAGVYPWRPGKAKPREEGLRPQDLYPPAPAAAAAAGVEERRAGFRSWHRPREMLIYTDGACSDNGKPHARGGCGFVFNGTADGRVSFRLEEVGPDGNKRPQTSNRAELRATIAALTFRKWCFDGVESIVVATDSVYVAEGATDWVEKWRWRDWSDRKGRPTKNRDLWLLLLQAMDDLRRDQRVIVKFWKIPRAWNKEADKAAKDAVALKPVAKYMDITSVGS
ncbi:hypothetical protein CkaCkLH20_11179 [Colletotrichum karsti]|uniref:ribonuclease H n=1 Tax=Colletotrichum karsti TaxID=1095194 RepID=A0A9P6LF95_9PEZI|nr:uncharacterized protein CkaCkLH20_11179 [Colletotrichum karsti]KAF9871258.1 hypothetical protein CkaCkLH20_11179 [Colletotrichum karsti]